MRTRRLQHLEERLRELGERQRLRDMRLFFQHATEAEFAEIIERVLDRKVRAFISGMDVDADVSVEVFYLEPAGTPRDDGASPR